LSRASLVEVYIAALPVVEIAIVGAGRQCRITPSGDFVPGEPVARRYYFKASHAELVLVTIGQDSMSGRPAATLADAIERAAAMLGAPFQSASELRKAAGLAVAEITARVKLASQEGGLKQINRRYKAYRLAQTAKGEKAVPYAKFIEQFTATIVRDAAGRMT